MRNQRASRPYHTGPRIVGAVDPEVALEFADKAQEILDDVKQFLGNIFGDSTAYSEGVEWLTAYYQYYVLGDSRSTTRRVAQAANVPKAWAWFATLLGVPVYDRFRLHALMGTDPANGADLRMSDQQRIDKYLSLGPDTNTQPRSLVAQAVQVAKNLKWAPQGTPGSWRNAERYALGVSEPIIWTPEGVAIAPPPSTTPPITTPPLNGGNNDQYPPPATKTAGMGTLLGVAAVVGVLVWVASTPQKKNRRNARR